MSKQIPALTDEQIRQAEPKPKPYKMHDGGGLFLVVRPNGTKSWRVSCYFEGKRCYMGLGTYPKTTLQDARLLGAEIHNQAKEGINPVETRKREIAVEKGRRGEASNSPRLCVSMDGSVEIWKGRDVVRLAREEAVFIREQLVLLS